MTRIHRLFPVGRGATILPCRAHKGACKAPTNLSCSGVLQGRVRTRHLFTRDTGRFTSGSRRVACGGAIAPIKRGRRSHPRPRRCPYGSQVETVYRCRYAEQLARRLPSIPSSSAICCIEECRWAPNRSPLRPFGRCVPLRRRSSLQKGTSPIDTIPQAQVRVKEKVILPTVAATKKEVMPLSCFTW